MEEKINIPAPPKELRKRATNSENAEVDVHNQMEETNIDELNLEEEHSDENAKELKRIKRAKLLAVIDAVVNWSGLVISLALLCLFLYFLFK